MKHVFVRIEEGRDTECKSISCLLLSGDRAQKFLDDPSELIKDYSAGACIIDNWVVPDDLENITTSDSIREVFYAFLALNVLGDFPMVSDLFATIFEAGYRLAESKRKE